MSQAVYVIRYLDRDITRSIAPYVTTLSYADKEHGGSAELNLTVEDSHGRWRDAWFPEKGDTIEAWMGYEGSDLLPCGSYQVDEVELSGPPDTVQIKALATGIRATLRTRRHRAFEGETLRGVAGRVAQAAGLTLEGTIPDVRFGRVTQSGEDDLAFLRRLAEAYGCIFSVRGERLVLTELAELEATSAVRTITRQQLSSYSLRSKTQGRAKAARVVSFNPVAGELLESTAQDASYPFEEMSLLDTRAEDAAQAAAIAKAHAERSRRKARTGTLALRGDPTLVAGVNVELEAAMGAFKGLFHVSESTHAVARGSGYTTELTVHGL